MNLSAQWELVCPECPWKLLLTGDLPEDVRAFDWSADQGELASLPSRTNDTRSSALREILMHQHAGGDLVAWRAGHLVATLSKLSVEVSL